MSATPAFRCKWGKYLPHQRANVDQVPQLFVFYPVDDDTSKHLLALESYGDHDGWVLLEKA